MGVPVARAAQRGVMARSKVMRDSQLFDKAIELYFRPLAGKIGLPLSKVEDGVFEIPSQRFILRIRLHTGHSRGLNVILRPASLHKFDENKDHGVLGIGNFIEFYGGEWKEPSIEIDSEEKFLAQTHRMAEATQRYAVPYLLGEGKDWEAIEKMVAKRTELAVEKIKKYPFLS